MPVGELGQHLGCEVVGVDLGGEAAVVALPGAEVAERAGERDRMPVRAVGEEALAVERQRGREPTRERHGKGAAGRGVPGRPARHEHDVAAVRRPGQHQVVRPPAHGSIRNDIGMEGEPPRRAAGGGDDVDVLVALVGRGVGDPAPVGREARHDVLAGIGGEPDRRAARPRHAPEIAGGDEDHVVAVDGRVAQQQRPVVGAGRGQGNEGGENGEKTTGHAELHDNGRMVRCLGRGFKARASCAARLRRDALDPPRDGRPLEPCSLGVFRSRAGRSLNHELGGRTTSPERYSEP